MRIKVTEASSVPLYKQMKEQIKTYILENHIEEGIPLPDIKTIASTAGVSPTTTERALTELIREGICFRRPKKGTFVGKSESMTQKKNACGIYHAKGVESFEKDLIQAQVYKGITEEAYKKEIDPFFIIPDAEKSISFYLSHKRLDLRGIIMLHWEELWKGKVIAERFPDMKFVYLNYYLDAFEDTPPNVYGIFNDDYAGAYQMTEHLINKGHREIAIFSIELISENYRQRIKGYRQAFKNNGLKFKRSLIYTTKRESGVDLRDIGRMLAGELISSGKRATAIFCVNDIIAQGVIEYLRERDEDKKIEVVGHDNVIPHISMDYNFSTVQVDLKKMGAKAIDIVSDKKGTYPKVLRIMPQILVRG